MTGATDLGFEQLRLGRQLCFPLYAATNLLQRLYRPLLTPLGLTYSQYLVMMVLWERGEAYVGELRRSLFLDIGTMTPLLKRMELNGLVLRRRDGADERRVRVELTGHGLALKEKAAHIPGEMSLRIGLDGAEIERMKEMTSVLVERLVQAAFASDAAQPTRTSFGCAPEEE